jgi:hypothetical protein
VSDVANVLQALDEATEEPYLEGYLIVLMAIPLIFSMEKNSLF